MHQPDLILTPFAQDAPPSAVDPIPESRSPSDPLEKASWTQGFPGLTMIPLAAGGIPPRGQDFNGVLNAISEHTVFQGGGGQYKWDAAYVAAKGGYPKDAVLQSDDGSAAYVSLIDNNSVNFNTNPAAIGVSWGEYTGVWSAPTVSQAEAEAGTATTRRAWTAQRVRQAIVAWWNGVSTTWSRGFVSSASAAAARNSLELGTAATRNAQTSATDITAGALMAVGAFGLGQTSTVHTVGSLDDHSRPTGIYDFVSSRNEGTFPPGEHDIQVWHRRTTGTAQQLAFSSYKSPGAMWFRHYSNESWGTWRELYHTGNISTASVAHAATATKLQTARTINGVAFDGTKNITITAEVTNAIGVGQTWQNVTASRARNTTYTNTTGRPIAVTISVDDDGWSFNVNGAVIGAGRDISGGASSATTFIVPAGSTYGLGASRDLIHIWAELR